MQSETERPEWCGDVVAVGQTPNGIEVEDAEDVTDAAAEFDVGSG